MDVFSFDGVRSFLLSNAGFSLRSKNNATLTRSFASLMRQPEQRGCELMFDFSLSLEEAEDIRQLSDITNNFIISFGDIIKYMAIVVQRLERTTVARKTRVRLSPFASNEMRRENDRPEVGLFAFSEAELEWKNENVQVSQLNLYKFMEV